MSAAQIVLDVIIAIVLYQVVKKIILVRTIKHYTPVELFDKLKNDRDIVLLDVRTKNERDAQFIKGSIHIPLLQLKAREGELEKFKEQEIVCYCRTGNRSLNAAAKLKKHGFNAANLKGGLVQWNIAGLR
ncbi:putative adenylyltransferase/sulfurtransferase MoeZ [bacterium BMS3Abin03]|nr:putative adenylyltransferase/sulfurtransferase MoeZ [bacterium BMS3Abin03]HDZ59107.1 rhodanese-like domain-containing protein [Ignavibacteriales bacterium]